MNTLDSKTHLKNFYEKTDLVKNKNIDDNTICLRKYSMSNALFYCQEQDKTYELVELLSVLREEECKRIYVTDGKGVEITAEVLLSLIFKKIMDENLSMLNESEYRELVKLLHGLARLENPNPMLFLNTDKRGLLDKFLSVSLKDTEEFLSANGGEERNSNDIIDAWPCINPGVLLREEYKSIETENKIIFKKYESSRYYNTQAKEYLSQTELLEFCRFNDISILKIDKSPLGQTSEDVTSSELLKIYLLNLIKKRWVFDTLNTPDCGDVYSIIRMKTNPLEVLSSYAKMERTSKVFNSKSKLSKSEETNG